MAHSPLDELLARRLIFVTGKGGVGKTTLSAAIGMLAARRGLRTLICELEPKGEIAQYFGVRSEGFKAVSVAENLFAMEMDTEEALYEYLRIYLRLPIPARLTPLAKTFDFVANAAPGVREILVVGKLCYEVRESHYDLIVADSSASGHIVSQLSSPRGVGDLFPVGLVKGQTDWMLDILSDKAKTGICLVSTAEETPIEEAMELSQRLSGETVVDLSLAVVNKVIATVFSPTEHEEFKRLARVIASDEMHRGGIEGLVRATELWSALAENNAVHVQRLQESLHSEIPFVEIPAIPGLNSGIAIVREVAETLEVELS